MQARCRLGFERRVDAAISRTVSETKTRTQSSEHGVVATGKHDHSSSSLFVEGHVRLLRGPDAMEQDGQLPSYRNDGLTLRLLTTSGGQVPTPLSQRRVSSMRSQDVVG